MMVEMPDAGPVVTAALACIGHSFHRSRYIAADALRLRAGVERAA